MCKLDCTLEKKTMTQGRNDKNNSNIAFKFTGASENTAEQEIYSYKCLH